VKRSDEDPADGADAVKAEPGKLEERFGYGGFGYGGLGYGGLGYGGLGYGLGFAHQTQGSLLMSLRHLIVNLVNFKLSLRQQK
jgi:hypothetical protein